MSAQTKIYSYEMLLEGNRARTAGMPLEQGDLAEIAAFCERLKGVRQWSKDEAPDMTPLPSGFHSVRIFDGRDNAMLFASWHIDTDEYLDVGGLGFSVTSRPVTAQAVIAAAHIFVFDQTTAWHGTRALPTTETGVLDLVVDVETKVRDTFIDGSELTPAWKALIAKQVAARERRAAA